jgi:tetratricopeptide (TPR) repeat protein
MRFRAEGNIPRPSKCFGRAVELEPNYIDAHNNLGNALQAVRDYTGAAQAYLAALRIQPDFYVGYNNLGNALRTMGKTDDAIVALEQAIRLRPDYHPAHCNLGNAQKDAGRLDDAMRSLSAGGGFAASGFDFAQQSCLHDDVSSPIAKQKRFCTRRCGGMCSTRSR